eukprot:6491809-Amphidinium_carterae.1
MRQREWQSRVNSVVALYTWLALGRPRSDRLANVMCLPLSATQRKMVQRMESCMLDFDRLSGASILGSGGLNSTLDDKMSSLADSRHEYLGVRSDAACDMEASPTMCLDSENASLPSVAARIPLEAPVIPPPLARLLLSEQGFARDADENFTSLPRRHLNISKWGELLRKLVQIGLARLVPLSEIPVCQGRPQLGGLFGVPKVGTSRVRMIVDRRPRNACELSAELALARFLSRHPMSWHESTVYPPSLLIRFGTLPHAALFVDALWTSTTKVLAYVEDAKDFFYLLAMPRVRHKESAFGLPVRAQEVCDLLDQACPPEERVIPVLTSVAMGDQKAMFLAQSAHQHSLWFHGALHHSSWLTWGYPSPSVGVWQGAYCDDYGQLAFLDQSLEGTPNGPTEIMSTSKETLSQVHAAYDATGFVLKPEKSRAEDPEPELWGARLSSELQTVSGKPDKMVELAGTTLHVVRNGAATSAQMRCLVGTWVHLLMFRRPAMCVLDYCYAWIEQPPTRPKLLRRLTGEVMDELLTLVLLMPWLRTSLSSAISSQAFLSDATLVRGAVVRSRLSLAASVALWRLLPRQSGALRWNDPLAGFESEEASRDIRCPLLADMVASMECQQVASFRFSHRAHVNVQEAVALRTAVKAASRDEGLWDTRIPFLVDSLVVQSTWCRGRSSSHQLNRIQQMALPYLLCVGLVPLYGWIPSECNPADDPTRDVPLREALALSPQLHEHLLGVHSRESWPWSVTR